jgi:hypothetical protein
MGAALKNLPLTEYRDPEKRGAETEALLFRIRALLTELKIASHHCGWSHAAVAEKLMPTPRPAKDESRNVPLAWGTDFNPLRSDVKNAVRNKGAKLMGGKHAAEPAPTTRGSGIFQRGRLPPVRPVQTALIVVRLNRTGRGSCVDGPRAARSR